MFMSATRHSTSTAPSDVCVNWPYLQVTVVCYAVRMYVYAALPKIGVIWAVLPVEVGCIILLCY